MGREDLGTKFLEERRGVIGGGAKKTTSVIILHGDSVHVFVGMVFQPLISDRDNIMVFGLEGATITLTGGLEGESLSISESTVESLTDLGISVSGKSLAYIMVGDS